MAQSLRHLARKLVLQGLYAEETGQRPAEEVAETVITSDELNARSLEFARDLFSKVREQRAASDETIARLAANWDINRMALVDKIIIRMAITELSEMPDVPVKVVLNEAIELAKEFSTAESSSFVNGILDSYVRDPSSGLSV